MGMDVFLHSFSHLLFLSLIKQLLYVISHRIFGKKDSHKNFTKHQSRK